MRGLLVTFAFLWLHIAKCDHFSKTIQIVANKFGTQMRDIGYERTCFKDISSHYHNHRSSIVQVDPTALLEDARYHLIELFKAKKSALENITLESERLASSHQFEKDIDYNYYNVKRLYDDRFEEPNVADPYGFRALELSSNSNFDDEVNLNQSAVHVPINVYEKGTEILNDIKWTESLTYFFQHNLHDNPTLSWQFFCSNKGFLRQYPAAKWKIPYDQNTKTKTPDLYDCRVRQWYIQAAASAKDIVILLDTSGSMTGLRKHIALNVVFNILDTLNEDDFVIVLKFSNEIKYVGDKEDKKDGKVTTTGCFHKMVQATKRNIREIKENLDEIKTADIANFSKAFIEAFGILKNFTKNHKGAECNQAVMLITDGAPETLEPIFHKYNKNSTIRVFTYVIGREVTQIDEVYWMACNNRGYYAQVANLAEVREQVQQYIPVMSRPLVLSSGRVFSWTPVYAPVSEIQLTDWIWEERVKAVKTKILRSRELLEMPIAELDTITEEKNDTEEVIEVAEEDLSLTQANNRKKRFNIEQEMAKLPDSKKKPHLMITISQPVIDDRRYINITKKILVKNVYKNSEPEEIRIANLLGVAGVDVPIREIERLTNPYKLGVNGYSFMLTNNGKVLFHPEYRPLFQDMLKPYYSSVDLTEVEISNSTQLPRFVDGILQQIRTEMINGTVGSKKLAVKKHIDSMKRPVFRTQLYVYNQVDGTPFSIAMVLPEPYGMFHFNGQIELGKHNSKNYSQYFSGSNWRVHPEWVYCENPLSSMHGLFPKNPEETILQFLNIELPTGSFKWREERTSKRGSTSNRHQLNGNTTCVKELVQALLFDAEATEAFERCSDLSFQLNRKDDRMIQIVNVFISTRSGLTRFSNPFRDGIRNKSESIQTLTKSIDEIFYRRAVDFHHIDSAAFVYSIDKISAKDNEVLVTASQAIYVTSSGKMSTPVAVVGVQYNFSQFYASFFKTTEQNKLDCSTHIECYILDNNAFVLLSETHAHAGIFFGEIDNDLLQDMVRTGVYSKTRFYDYQEICVKTDPSTKSASFTLLTPFNYIKNLLIWLGTRLVSFYLNLFYNSHLTFAGFSSNSKVDYNSYDYESDTEVKFNKTKPRPKPCDVEIELYELTHNANQTLQYVHTCLSNDCAWNYYVKHIPHSNLILLVLDKSCDCSSTSTIKFEFKEVTFCEGCCNLTHQEPFRKRPGSCYNHHPQESEIKYCGKGTCVKPNFLFVIFFLPFLFIAAR